MAETTVTTATMTALSVSKRSAHCACSWRAGSRSPVSIQVNRSVVRTCPPSATSTKRMTPNKAARPMPAQVMSCAPRSPIQRPKKPAMNAPSSGRKMAAIVTRSALHQMDVFDRNGAAVAEIDDEDGEADRRLGRGHGQHEHGEDLDDQIAEKGREGDEIDVDGEQHQLDRHQDDDDILAIEEDAEDPQREQDRGDRQVMAEADREHPHIPWRGRTLTTSSVSSRRRPICRAMFCRRTPSRARKVSTMAPTMAT